MSSNNQEYIGAYLRFLNYHKQYAYKLQCRAQQVKQVPD
jgi:hypothetical protein